MAGYTKRGKMVEWVEHGKKITVDDVLKFKMLAVPQQTISQEDAEYFEIRSELDAETGSKIVATYFPYYDQRGHLTGFKRRNWLKSKNEKGHFTVIGSVSTSSMLFGQHKCNKNDRRPIYFVEGEGDCVATRRALLDSLKGTKWEGKFEFNVVSLNCGAANAEESTAHNEEFLRSGSCLVLRMDADHATPREKLKHIIKGEEAMDIIAAFLLWDEIYTIDLPEGMKDPRDMVEEGRSAELGKLLSWDKKHYSPEKITDMTDVSVTDLRRSGKTGVPIHCFPRFSAMSKGPAKGELWVGTGPSGAGKSTIVRRIEHSITHYLIDGLSAGDLPDAKIFTNEDGKIRLLDFEDGEKIGAIHLEEDKEETINSWIALDKKVDEKDFVESPEQYLTEEEHGDAFKYYRDSNCVRLLDHFGSIPVNQLINKLKQLYAAGCRWFILDHLSMVISGLRVADERKELDIVMTELAAFAKQHNVFILAVSHINRQGFINPPKDKDGNTLPYWITVRKEQLRGCVDKDTEFLSETGWKKISDYEQGDKVYAIDEHMVGGFTLPVAYIKRPCDEMWQFTSRSVDMMVSDEHRVPYYHAVYRDNLKFLTAKEIADTHNRCTTGFRGLIPTTFTTGEEYSLGLNEHQLRLQVAVNADGWIKNPRTGLCSVRIKKERKINRMEELLDKSSTHYSRFDLKGDRVEFSFIAPLKMKGYTADWYKLKQSELAIIKDEIRFWDAYVVDGRFSSIEKDDADFVQFCYSSQGINSKMTCRDNLALLPKNDGSGESRYYNSKDLYSIGYSNTQFVSMRKSRNSRSSVSRVKTKDGFKYCFTVETGMFLARRNGKIFVTGNSSSIEQLSWNVFSVEPEELPNRARGRVRIVDLKNRRGKRLGIADTIWMNKDGTFTAADGWEYDNGCYWYKGEKMAETDTLGDVLKAKEHAKMEDVAEPLPLEAYTAVPENQDEPKQGYNPIEDAGYDGYFNSLYDPLEEVE